jgi:hypothetical protein
MHFFRAGQSDTSFSSADLPQVGTSFDSNYESDVLPMHFLSSSQATQLCNPICILSTPKPPILAVNTIQMQKKTFAIVLSNLVCTNQINSS